MPTDKLTDEKKHTVNVKVLRSLIVTGTENYETLICRQFIDFVT